LFRKILPILMAVVALLVSACGTGTTPSHGASHDAAGAFPVTVEHAMGSTTIDSEPMRIVALDSSYADATLLLEKELVGITTYRAYSTDLPDYLGDARSTYASEVVSVGELSAPSLEQIAALQPDLIVSAKVRHEALYGQLSAIAPTIMSETTGATFKENIRMLAKAVGREQLAAEKLSAYEKAAAEVGTAVNQKAGNPTISVTRFLDGPTRLYLKDSYSGNVLQDAGLARPEAQSAPGFSLEISEENIRQADADKIFVTLYADEAGTAAKTKEAFQNNPLWQPLAPKVVEVSDQTWMTAVSIQGAYHILTDIANAFDVPPPAMP
jgi:iron complex transport system substrate-binding protein